MNMKVLAKKERLEKRFSFRMTDEESARLAEAAKKLGCKPSDAARMAVSALAMATGSVELAS